MKKIAPTARQKDFHNQLARLGCMICRGPARLHHCVGASARHNKIAIGQWWLIPLCDEHHQHGPEAVHVSPEAFAKTVGVETRKQAEKVLFSEALSMLEKNPVPLEVVQAIDSYRR